jgi:glutamate/tyrosine decarboxylase-like PLP-dependent enzyme
VPAAMRSKPQSKSGESFDHNAELDELNNKIMLAVQRGGRAYVSSATLRGRFALRTCITNFRTTRADIDETLEIIREAARDLSGQSL